MPKVIVATPPPRVRTTKATTTITASIATTMTTTLKIPLHQKHLKRNYPISQLENGKREEP